MDLSAISVPSIQERVRASVLAQPGNFYAFGFVESGRGVAYFSTPPGGSSGDVLLEVLGHNARARALVLPFVRSATVLMHLDAARYAALINAGVPPSDLWAVQLTEHAVEGFDLWGATSSEWVHLYSGWRSPTRVALLPERTCTLPS